MVRPEEKVWIRLAPALVIGAGITWGLIGLFSVRLARMGLSALQITLARCLVAGLILAAYLAATGRDKLRIRLRDLWVFVGSGIVSIAFFNICYFMSIGVNSLSVAAILLYTSPCFVMLMSCLFFREPMTGRKLLALFIAFAGCVMTVGLFQGELRITLAGLLTGLGSGLGYALYSIFARVALRSYSWLTVITYTFALASAALLPFSRPLDFARVVAAQPLPAIGYILLLGTVSTLLPFVLYTKGLHHMDTGRAALLTFVEPMVATVVGVAVFGDRLRFSNLGGMALIVLSIVVLSRRAGQSPGAPSGAASDPDRPG